MKTILEQHVPHNTGCSGEVKDGQTIRIKANSPFNLVTHENRWHDRQMEHTQVRPKERNYMDLRVEMIIYQS